MDSQQWIFTFGVGQKNEGCCVRVNGTFDEARAKMMFRYGKEWSFQYDAAKWDEWKKDPDRAWTLEREIDEF